MNETLGITFLGTYAPLEIGNSTLRAKPLAQFDRVSIRIANLRASIVWPHQWPPGGMHTPFMQEGKSAVHVGNFQCQTLPAKALLRRARGDELRVGVAHHFYSGAAKFKIDQIKRAKCRCSDALTLALMKAQQFLVEADRAIRISGQELDVVDAFEHALSLLSSPAVQLRYC